MPSYAPDVSVDRYKQLIQEGQKYVAAKQATDPDWQAWNQAYYNSSWDSEKPLSPSKDYWAEWLTTLDPQEAAGFQNHMANSSSWQNKVGGVMKYIPAAVGAVGLGGALGLLGGAEGAAAAGASYGGGSFAEQAAINAALAEGGGAGAAGAGGAAAAGAAGAAATGGTVGSTLSSLGSSLWSAVPLVKDAAGAINAAGTLAGLYGAYKADQTQQAAVSAQTAAAEAQQRLAQEQWDYQKNVYLPKAMQQADDQLALSKKIADAQIADADYYRGLAGQSFDQAKKSWKYQDQYMGLTDDYMSGKVGNADADRANADVEQAYANGLGSMMRSAGRYGINPGSGAFTSTMGDMYNEKMLAGAGAQTNARLAARQKAESMVAIAAGAGQAGFGTGMSAGQLATGSLGNAGSTNNTSLNGLNSVSNTNAFGNTAASNGYTGSSNTWNSAVRNSGSALADYGSGLATGWLKNAAANTTTPSYSLPWNVDGGWTGEH